MKGWKGAIIVAALALIVDAFLHYTLPETVDGVQIAFRESLAYFAVKFLVYAAMAYIFILFASFGVESPLSGPVIYGLLASTLFGAFYYAYPQVSVGTGSMPILLKGLWGAIHWGGGTLALGLYQRRVSAVLFGIVLVTVSAATLVFAGPFLAGIAPTTGTGSNVGY